MNNHKPFSNIWLFVFLMIYLFNACTKEIPKSEDRSKAIKFIDAGSKDIVNMVKKTNDGGFIYCGSMYVDGGKLDAFLMKIDSNGNKVWYKKFGGLNNDEFTNVIQTSDGGYLAVGFTNSIGSGVSNATFYVTDYVVKVNAMGVIEWENSFFSDPCVLDGCVESADHYYYFTGNNTTPTSNPFGVNLMKLDANGNKIFVRYYTYPTTYPPGLVVNPYHVIGRDVTIGLNGSIQISGLMSRSNRGDQIAEFVTCLINTKTNGGVNYFYPYYNYVRGEVYVTNIRYPFVKTLTTPNGYITCSHMEDTLTKATKMGVLKTDASGAPQWEKEFGGIGNALIYYADTTSNGDIMLLGGTSMTPLNVSFPKGFANLQPMILVLDKNGNKLWEYISSEMSNVNTFRCINQMSDGSYKVAGVSTQNESSYDKMFWLHLDKNGKILEQ